MKSVEEEVIINRSRSEIDIEKLANTYKNIKQNSEEIASIAQIDKMNNELKSSIRSSRETQIDKNGDRYPYCIVWTV